MTEISRILDQFYRATEGDAWHGTPLLSILEGITAKQAMLRPLATAHTIWELLLHITAWEGEVLRRLRTGEAALPEEGDWQIVEDSSESAWEQAQQRYNSVHGELVQEIMNLSDNNLDTVPAIPRMREVGTGVSLYVLLHGIVQHGIYHAGQIALLKKGTE